LELKKLGGGKRGLVRIIGPHPSDNEPIEAYSGRFGPYVKHGGINAPIPRDRNVDELSIDEAVKLIEERRLNPPDRPEKKAANKKTGDGAAKSGATKSGAASKAGASKAGAAKKGAAKKGAAKKGAAKKGGAKKTAASTASSAAGESGSAAAGGED
ncbi:MAG: hypothetical protein H7X80_04425, partial [bacterium]|nr:hypothetical protein [Candidatus Kapabacteria bacterium]